MNVVSMPHAQTKAPGRVITFYSYKGGTGRSMALANVAWMLALNGARVLVVDWDLEAPGIHRYFHPFLGDKELKSTPGLIDMVEMLASMTASSKQPIPAERVDIIDYIEPLEWPRENEHKVSWKRFGLRAGIDFMPAGRQGPAYSRKLSAFNWIDFYERLDGRRLLGIAREQMCRIYDYVLIDSRTGVSDTSGICTVEMPDLLVICFTLNEQSIKGASGIAESVLEHKRSKDRVDVGTADMPPDTRPSGPQWILPVPTRVEITSEREKREAALSIAERTFAGLVEHLSADERRKYWGGVQMAYFPYYAFEEIPAVFADKPDELLSLTTSIKSLTRAISEPPIGTLPGLDTDHEVAERIRKEIVGWYLRPVSTQSEPVRLAQHLFDNFNDEQRELMRRVLLRCVAAGATSGQTGRAASLYEFSDAEAKMAELLTERQLLAISVYGQRRLVAIRESGVVAEQWRTLHDWVDTDRRFLVWRVQLTGASDRWLQSDHDEGALLRGRLLEEVDAWLPKRRDDLSHSEREFIRVSRANADEEARAREQSAAAASVTAARVERLEELLREAPRPATATVVATPTRNFRLIVGAAVTAVAVLAAGMIYTLLSSQRQLAQLAASQAESEQLRKELLNVQQQAKTAQTVQPGTVVDQSCPDVQKIELPPANLRTTFAKYRRLDRECVIQAAATFSGRPGVDRSMFVPFVLWANGLQINPKTCSTDCLERNLKLTKSPRPGDVAIDSSGRLGVYVGGQRYVVQDPSTAALGRVQQVQRFLQVPYDDPTRGN